MKKSLAIALSMMLMVLCLAPVAQAAPSKSTTGPCSQALTARRCRGMVDAFNASQDEVHVNHTPMTADDLYQKIPMTVQTAPACRM